MNSTTHNKKKNVAIWAVDPTQNPDDAQNLIKEMQLWAKHLKFSIQPVSIFSNRTLGFFIEVSSLYKKQLEELTEHAFDAYFKKVNLKDALDPKKIFISSNSTRKMALELAKYADKTHALLIFANTKARKTWNPLRLGGFVETLVTISRTPVLLLNLEATPSSQVSVILFPTDFSRNSYAALTHLSPWVKSLNCKIILYNQIEIPAVYYMPELSSYLPPAPSMMNFESILKDVEKTRQKKANRWLKTLEKQNIDAQIIFGHQQKPLASDILDVAKKHNISIIAMASQSGPMAQTILGGAVRDVLLQATCPVIVFYRPKAKRKHVEKPRQAINKNHKKQIETNVVEAPHI